MNKPTRIRNTFIVFLFLVAASVSAQQMSAREWNSRGRELQNNGNFYDAIDAYQQALQINPNYTAPLLGSAACYFSLGEYEQALVFAERARSISPRTIEILIMEARIRVALGELEKAESLFRGVLGREPNNLQAKLGLAELQIAEGRVEQAATWYVKALQQAPHHERSLLSLYLIYSRAGRQEAAVNYLQEALKYHPNSWQVQFYAAEHYGELGDEKSLQLALEHVHNAAILNEGNLEVSLLQADIFIRRSQMSSISDERRIGNLENAVQTLREYLSRGEAESEQRALAYFSLGIALDRLGKVEESINHFQASLAENPIDEIVRIALENQLIHWSRQSGNLSDLRSRFADGHFQQAGELQERYYYEKAIEECRRGLMLDPRRYEGRMMYAELLRTLGYRAKYLDQLAFLLKQGHDNTELLDAYSIYRNILSDSVAARWDRFPYGPDGMNEDGYSQFDRPFDDPSPYRFGIFYLQRGGLDHTASEPILTRYIQDSLQGLQNIDFPAGSPSTRSSLDDSVAKYQVRNQTEAFRKARSAQIEYYLVLSFTDENRTFAVDAELHHAGTGSLITSRRVIRSGNNRVRDAAHYLRNILDSLLPFRGVLLERRFERGLINAGKTHGLKEQDKLFIIRKGELDLETSEPDFSYSDEHVLGEFLITSIDDALAEGNIQHDPLEDLINAGDLVIRAPEPSSAGDTEQEQEQEEMVETESEEGESSLLKRILNLE